MRTLLALLLAVSLWPGVVAAGWDPLQKAERAAARGARLWADGDSVAAANSLLEAQALAPDNDRIRMGLAEVFYKNGEFQSALGQYRSVARDEAATVAQRKADATYNAGNAAFELGDYQQALDFYTEALLGGTAAPDVLFNLELAQKMLEAAKSKEDGEPQEGEQDGQEPKEGEQEQEGKDGEKQPGQEPQQEDASQQQEAAPDSTQQQPQQQPASADSSAAEQPENPPAAADSVLVPPGMSVTEAMRLLDALDHDEEELRKSIVRRLRSGDTEKAGDW